ncbi:unnamed protein product [Heligmosomoides polygyrus]|uniref:Reverse transcriptase domain-containing protein n=1 Tax=Heligmosomoides polygyrus TaxID=6339 RepID=A0A183GPN2_HELPZ|nr:unnamed protein product [Heligmosomoides polygyrus]
MIVSERFRDAITSVERFDDLLMKIVAVEERRCLPRRGCSEQTNDEFWSVLDEKTAEVPSQDMVVVAGNTTGPDDLPADLWKSKGLCSADWLTEFFNQVVAKKKVPESWQESTTIPIWKKKGTPADCASYRPIRLSHTMEIFERTVDGRIWDVQLSTNQCGFVSGCGTVDAIHAVRLLLEKHREKQKPRLVVQMALTEVIERRFSVKETKMLRWMAGVTRLDRVRNDSIRQRFGTTPTFEKMREARLRWYGPRPSRK